MPGVSNDSLESLPSPSASQTISVDARIGAVIDGRYRLLSAISSGSMGRVYRAEQLQLDRVVAIKVMELNPSLITDPDIETYRQRFLNEAGALARLMSPYTVRIFDFGFWGQAPYLVMEFVDGTTLSRLVRTEGPLPVERSLRIAEQVCRSLHEAHQAGIVHRDLKPGNILISRDDEGVDQVKEVDFGLVKVDGDGQDLTIAGQILGSPNYMAPELIREDEQIDGRADVYALGITLFRMLTRKAPFSGGQTATVLMAHLQRPLPA